MPEESWELPELAKFITVTLRRSGGDVWWIGKALHIARGQHKVERDWLRWLKAEVDGLSRATAYRYADVYEHFTLEAAAAHPINVLYRLMRDRNDPESSGDGDDQSTEAADDDDTSDDTERQPAVAGKIHSTAPSTTADQDTDRRAGNDQEPPDEPQPPVTDAEIDMLEVFVKAVGGITRAEFVFEQGVEQLKELAKDD